MFLIFLAAGVPVFGQYGGFGGPSILSRGNGASGRTGTNPIGFRPFLGVTGTYFTNLNDLSSSTTATSLRLDDSYGVTGSAGLQGYRTGERSATSVDLLVSYSWQDTGNVSRGLSESLALTHSRQVSRRVMWYFGAAGNSTNRSVVFANQRFSAEPLPELTPQNEEIFDSRVTRANVGTGFTFQKSARLAFSGQAGAFGAERRSRVLADSRGFLGSGSMQYSLSRRQYVGAAFSYGTFYFPGTYGETKFFSPQLYYGVALDRQWNLNIYAGIFRAHTDRLVAVQLDPFIAQLTGQRSVLETFKGDQTGFSGGVNLNGNLRQWGVTASATRAIVPGNGIYLTSLSTNVAVSVNHTLSRSVSWALYARGTENKALTQTLGNARYYSAGTSFSYRLNSYLSLSSSAGVYRTRAAGQLIEINRFTASAGVYFSPGDLPLHIF